jgi:hypothetical protein
MSNIINELSLERLYDRAVEQDAKGLIEDDINKISTRYNLHPDDDRDQILQIIAEIQYEEEL